MGAYAWERRARRAENRRTNSELTHHLIARSHVHYDDARRKDFYIARARAIASASHRHAMAPRIAGSRAGNRKACECEWRHAGHAGVGV